MQYKKQKNNGVSSSILLEKRQSEVWKRDNLNNSNLDWLANEVPVALVYNGISHVVMMTTPRDLEMFAVGFSISEGIITKLQDIFSIDIIPQYNGIEIQIIISNRCFMTLKEHRRTMVGYTGCGLCGIDSINQVIKKIDPLPFTQKFKLNNIDKALDQLKNYQIIGNLTGCTHVAAWMSKNGVLINGYEDIGRHVALDKLLGYCEKHNLSQGAILISSRASHEIVQKTAKCGIEILFAVSAATKLAVNTAKSCKLTLVGFSRPEQATVYSYPQRLY